MSIDITFFSILVITIVANLGLLLYILRLDEPFGVERLMAAYCLLSLGVAGALALTDTNTIFLGYAPGLWMVLASFASVCLLGAITFGYLELPRPNWWLLAIPIVTALVLILDSRDPAPGLAELTWRAAINQPGNWLAISLALLWALIGSSLIAVTYFSRPACPCEPIAASGG